MISYNPTYRSHKLFAYLCIALMLFTITGMTSSSSVDKDLVKSASLCKIADFIDWPYPPESFQIVFLSKNEDLRSLGNILREQTIKGRPIVAQYASTIQEIKKADILYVSADFNTDIQEVVRAFTGKATLLVAETPGYGSKGVHINFFITRGGTLHFELNPDAFQRSGLRVNNMLIEYAKIIK